MTQWAQNNNASLRLIKNASLGYELEYFTIEINYVTNMHNKILISQTATGTDIDVGLSYLKFKNYDPELINFDLSLYQKGFFEKILNSNKIKTGNKTFDNKFGIYCPQKTSVLKLFNDEKVQCLFLNNVFLVFNVQKSKSLVTLKSMEVKLYEIVELQELLDNFVYILKLINKSNL